uniref:ATP synthase mitochondrial F1 complex assembly factor 2 n=1 Tax=Ailuropoda melanoleuca TaxID=9646 RepID=G1LEM4_AILME
MWRSILRLRHAGRRFLNPLRGALTASVGPGPNRLTPARAYAPPTGGFEINLDHRKLKTPQAKLFTVPSEALAIAVATEWDSQQDTIKFYTMHLTTLCNTSLDNPTQRNKDQLIRAAVKFLDTDTICYRVEEPATLVELQKNEWDPIIEWAEKRYDVEIGSSTSIMGPSIPARTREVLVSHLASYNMWALQGIEFVVTQLKSLVLTLGLMDLRLTVEQAVLLSRLEEEYQVRSRLCPPWFRQGGGGEGGLASPRTARLCRFGLSRLSRTSRNQNSGPVKVLSRSSNTAERYYVPPCSSMLRSPLIASPLLNCLRSWGLLVAASYRGETEAWGRTPGKCWNQGLEPGLGDSRPRWSLHPAERDGLLAHLHGGPAGTTRSRVRVRALMGMS